MLKLSKSNIYYVLIPILIMGISLGFSSFLISLIVLLPLLFTTNRHTLAIYFVMYGGSLGGVIRAAYPFIPIYGMLILLLGLFLMRDLVINLFKTHFSAILSILATLGMFGIFYAIGPQDAFSRNKYFSMFSHGMLMVVAFFAFDRSKNIEAEKLAKLLIVTTICMFSFIIGEFDLQPQGLFNYNWFRDQLLTIWDMAGDRNTIITYQQIGMMALFSLAIYLSQIQLQRGPMFFFVLCTAQLALVSGCRQAIVGIAIVITFRFAVFRLSNLYKKNLLRKIVWMTFGLILAYLVFMFVAQHLQSDYITNTLEEGDYIRERIYELAYGIFLQYPITGAGLGGYHHITDYTYPHNFFLELLCETGLIGFTISLLILVIPLIRNKQGLLHINLSNQFFFLILLGSFVRVMVSSDLTESIELFSAVIAITSSRKLL